MAELLHLTVLSDTKYTYTVDPDVARVVSIRPDVYAAHWDSGHPDTPAITVELWTGEVIVHEKLPVDRRTWDDSEYKARGETLPDRYEHRKYRTYVPLEVNATDKDLAEVEAYRAAVAFVKNVFTSAEAALKLGVGVVVMVVRGRKVPKGDYEVTRHDLGSYGPYVNLRDLSGKTYTYVSIENVEVVPNYHPLTFQFVTPGSPEEGFWEKFAAADFRDLTAWLVYADWLEDKDVLPRTVAASKDTAGVEPALFCKHLRAEIARRHAAGTLRVDNADAYRYNRLSRGY